jgi:hypothetical protein
VLGRLPIAAYQFDLTSFPVDELRMLFCEMCDRAFSLDLLDPPLRKAPLGLWICGQCVDCKVCRNTSEPSRQGDGSVSGKSSISLKYWSSDPEKCYRCGGCDGMAELIVGDKLECEICKKILRSSDGDFVKCDDCKARIHFKCDRRADDFIQQQRTEEMFGTRTLKAQKAKVSTVWVVLLTYLTFYDLPVFFVVVLGQVQMPDMCRYQNYREEKGRHGRR